MNHDNPLDAFRHLMTHINQQYEQNCVKESKLVSRKPQRDLIINDDDICNLKIALETCSSVDELIENV